MTSLIRLPSVSNAFTDYRPSKNAHTDFLGQSALGKRKETGPKVINLTLPPHNDFRPAQEELKEVISAIPDLLNARSTSSSYHALSSGCHRLVTIDKGSEIYKQVEKEMKSHISALGRDWRGSVMGREEGWLGKVVEGWRVWQERVKLLAAVFTYLDRIYASPAKVPLIEDLGVVIFREGIWKDEILKSRTKDELLSWVSSERSLGQPDNTARSTISKLSTISQTLSTFHTLSDPYLESLSWYYSDEANDKISKVENGTMSAGGYVSWVMDKVEEERERAIVCLDKNVAITAVGVVRSEGGFKKRDQIVRRALDEAMDLQDIPALQQLYRFSVDCDAVDTLVKALQSHIQDRLTKLISDPTKDPEMIEGILTIKRFIDKAIKTLFERPEDVPMGDDEKKDVEKESLSRSHREHQIELEDAVRVGFKAGIGSRQNAPAEWIAKHLDSAMRKGQGSGTEGEFHTLLDEIISLVGYTKDKDVFKAFYSTQLAKRLLLNKSASDDMERTMIMKLQKEMGEEFTSGDVMMKDLALSETLVKSYQQAQSKNPDQYNDPGSFTANVLTESAWPAYPLLKDGWNFKLTPELQTSIDQFTQWYSSQHKNRQLSWRWQLATVSLTARFPSGRYEVGVSLFQAVTLLQFNNSDSLTFKQLKDQTGIEHSELVRTVQSLAMGRKSTRVLVKKPSGKEVNPDDVLLWNKAFTSDRVKFRINSIQQDLSSEESKQTNDQIAIDRVSVLEATIVRIMKGKKTMTLQLLIDAVVTEVSKRFPPDIKDLKKRVESLIEREFLIRDENDRNVLNYLA